MIKIKTPGENIFMVTMKSDQFARLFKACLHVGHKVKSLNPKMVTYVYAESRGHSILDLVQTDRLLDKAVKFCTKSAKKKKTFLFVGTSGLATASSVAREAKKCNSYYVNYRWLAGILSNWDTVKDLVGRLRILEKLRGGNDFNLLTKKEATSNQKELDKLKRHLGGIKNMRKLPDVVIVIGRNKELIAVKEAASLGIPIIALLDTDCDPDLISYPIPGNDDSTCSVNFVLETLSQSIVKGTLNS